MEIPFQEFFGGIFIILFPVLVVIALYYLFIRDHQRIDFLERITEIAILMVEHSLQIFYVGYVMVRTLWRSCNRLLYGDEYFYVRQIEEMNIKIFFRSPPQEMPFFQVILGDVFGDEEKYTKLTKAFSREEEFMRSLKKQ